VPWLTRAAPGVQAPLALDSLHLHASCLSLQAAAVEAAQTSGASGAEVVVDLQRMLIDSRYSPSLEMAGEVAIGRMDALDVKARRAMQRLMRDVLSAMAGHSLASMLNPVALFARAAPSGTMSANGFRELVSTLQVTASESVVYAGWRAMCQDSHSHDGVDVTSFLRFFRVKAVAHKQPCSLELLSTLPSWQEDATAASRSGGGGHGGESKLEGGSDRQKQLLKELLRDSDLWRAYRESCATLRLVQRPQPGEHAAVPTLAAVAPRAESKHQEGPALSAAAAAPSASGVGQGASWGAPPVASSAAGADKAIFATAAAAAPSTTDGAARSGIETGGKHGTKGDTNKEDKGQGKEAEVVKARDKALKALAKELKPKVAGITESDISAWLQSLEEALAADCKRKAARLRAVLYPARAEAEEAAHGGGQGQAHGAAGVAADGKAPSSQSERAIGNAADDGAGVAVSSGTEEGEAGAVREQQQRRLVAVRRALETRGLLLEESAGGGWAPARLAVQGKSCCGAFGPGVRGRALSRPFVFDCLAASQGARPRSGRPPSAARCSAARARELLHPTCVLTSSCWHWEQWRWAAPRPRWCARSSIAPTSPCASRWLCKVRRRPAAMWPRRQREPAAPLLLLHWVTCASTTEMRTCSC